MSVLYHVAPHECRESIRESGLSNSICPVEVWSDCDRWDEGTYLWESVELAERYRKDSFPVPADIYQVHVDGLPVVPDMTAVKDGKLVRVEGAWHCPEMIPSERLHLTGPLEECFYHGTSRAAWERIRTEGLGLPESANGAYLTNDFGAAADYASPDNLSSGVVIRVSTGVEMTFQRNGTPSPPYFRDSWHEDSMFGFAWEFDGGVIPPRNLRLIDIPGSSFIPAAR